MNSARVCVVTVVLNAAQQLAQTVKSVLDWKTECDLDYVIIDGGSTDGTVSVIRSCEEKLRYWVSEPDMGIYDAMNKGWAAAPFESFILFLGAGDRLLSLPEDLGRYSTNDVIYGKVQYGTDIVFGSRAGFHLKLYNSLHHQALLVNKACHPAPPFDIRYPLYADFDFNQRLLKSGVRFVESTCLLAYALPGGASDRKNFLQSLAVIGKNFGIFWFLLASCAFVGMRIFPGMRKLTPINKGKLQGKYDE